MPKENINSSRQRPDVHAKLEVCWETGRLAYTQVGTVYTNLADPDVRDVCFIDLDRAGINRLIRSLRKARDAAYGADA